jgi:DNA repair protein RadC
MTYSSAVKGEIIVKEPEAAYGVCKRIARKDREHCIVLTLDGTHKILKTHLVSIGLVNKTIVHPREVFRPAIADNAAAVIVSHNHPSGSLEPSPEDLDITERLKQAAEILGITFLDHIIVSKKGFRSMKETGRL